ncbi:hypothetical protein O4214_05270 [Rhodococcus erythropolis]|uniref:hypothetical protein n=1 Tax=Rhodococcus erythropolis TaxID=1833 RepID=UPI001E54E209|nr:MULTISPECIES: hypothetical protein [Rhodococcus erythropolis group]MCD2104328.1 hypothetical protein [Rhodococcus qingshengii]MCZ4523383.1 hypothetical protein [Rhodococcus erythropolis]
MGVVITSVGTSYDRDSGSVVTHAARAVRQALTSAAVEPQEVGVLINTGVYRDSNTVEPAIAALIQKDAGIGLEYGEHDPRTFSFDLMNGACGVLNAVQVADAILSTGSTGRVLVVSGDTHPSAVAAGAPDDFPYATSGAALLLERSEGAEGFGQVHTELADGPSVIDGFVETKTMGANGRNLITVERDADAEERLLDVALAAASAAIDASDPDLSSTVLIASTPTPGFPALLAAKLGITALDAAALPALGGDTHTAALPVAYQHAVQGKLLGEYSTILFVAAGAGPSAAATVYHLTAGADAK